MWLLQKWNRCYWDISEVPKRGIANTLKAMSGSAPCQRYTSERDIMDYFLNIFTEFSEFIDNSFCKK